ncbi:MAG: MC/SLC25 family protein [Flavobacterium sp.]
MDIVKNISAAGISAVTTVTCIHPIDVVKTRLQISSKETRNYNSLGITGTIKIIAKEEGLRSFWKGISAAWLREASYTSLRLGLYTPIKQAMGVDNQSHFIMKFSAGSLAGAIGSLVGNPFDVVKTRMMTFEGKHTTSFLSTIQNIYIQENARGLYKGLQANLMRACVLNGTKMACYDEIKQFIIKTNLIPSGITTQFFAAFGSGFFMASAVAPFDMIRTKLMNQTDRKYNGFMNCFVKIIKERGVSGLYAGFIPIWARFAPTTCLQLIIFEQIKPILGVEKMGE